MVELCPHGIERNLSKVWCCQSKEEDIGKSYVTGAATKEDPLVYHVTDEFLEDFESGSWSEGMMQAAVKEIRRLRTELAIQEECLQGYRSATDDLRRATAKWKVR